MDGQSVPAEGEPPDPSTTTNPYRNKVPPRSLADALDAAGTSLDGGRAGSETPSEEDYDENVRPTLTVANELRRRMKPAQPAAAKKRTSFLRRDSGVHISPDDDKSLQEFLQRSSERAKRDSSVPRAAKFRGRAFTHQFSAFDRHNADAANSPFHGFYTLFWLGVAIFVCKISAENWRQYGHPLGSNEIMKTMFSRDGEFGVGSRR